MSTPAEVVDEQFSNATGYADAAISQLETFTNALADAVYTTPTFAVTWAAIDAPSATSIPTRPAQLDTILGELTYDSGSVPSIVDPTVPDITIDDFSESSPVLSFGVVPVLDFGDKPVAPSVADIVVPDAPSITLPDAPDYLTLSTPTFGGVDYFTTMQTAVAAGPATLTLAAPTAYSYTPSAAYTSALLTALRATLTTRLAGGTGLDPTVEQAIWDRERSREQKLGQANEDQVMRNSEALGFKLPTGISAYLLRKAQQDTVDKVSTASRDVAIKQAELEQQNLDKTVATVLDCEGKLIDQSLQLERIAFESAAKAADSGVAIYNAQVDKYRALLTYFSEFRQAYQALIDGEKLKLEVYRGELQAEQTKAEVNRTIVEEFKAKIDAQTSVVRLFEAQLAGVKAQVDIESVKIASFGEEVKAYVAGVNAETSKVEAIKVTNEAEKVKVDAFVAQATAYKAKAEAQGEKSRAQISYYEAVIRSNVAAWDGYRARAGAEAERLRALSAASSSVLDSFRAETDVALKIAEQDIRRWEIGIKQYEGQANYTLQAAKINADVLNATRQAALEAAKVGASVFAQVTGSALGMIHATAGVSGTSGETVSYSYGNDTTTAAPTVTSI